jgi:vacuolar iron transporter family protein
MYLTDPQLFDGVCIAQGNEITESSIYENLSRAIKDRKNAEVLRRIAKEELNHYVFLKTLTGKEMKPSWWKVLKFYWVCRIFGLTFGVKLMERGEESAQKAYFAMAQKIPGIKKIFFDEEQHEKKLINMIREDRLQYVGSVVLGLNDALVEFTGVLAGVTFAFQDSRLIALTGLITGIAAALSMGSSEYLSKKADADEDGSSAQSALKASIYTGIAYIFTVFFLVLPYLLLPKLPFVALGVMIAVAVLIIYSFNYYIAVAKDYNFKKRFLEMLVISFVVAAISLGVGYLVRTALGIDI